MIKGITVTLHVRTRSGTDAFNRPVYAESTVDVDNVLIGQPSSEDAVNELNLTGKRIEYTLCIPKGDTHEWENTRVEFFGQTWDTVGFVKQYIEDLVPLDWNKQILVSRHE